MWVNFKLDVSVEVDDEHHLPRDTAESILYDALLTNERIKQVMILNDPYELISR